MNWGILYHDLSYHLETDGAWSAATVEGVITVVYLDPDPSFDVAHLHGVDFYIYRPDPPWSDPYPFGTMDLKSVLEQMGHTPPDPFPKDPRAYLASLGGVEAVMVKFGVVVPRATFIDLMNQVQNHPSFPFDPHRVRRRQSEDWGWEDPP